MLRAIDRLYLSCQVKWAEQQKILHRVKRDGIPTDPKFREMWYLVSNLINLHVPYKSECKCIRHCTYKPFWLCLFHRSTFVLTSFLFWCYVDLNISIIKIKIGQNQAIVTKPAWLIMCCILLFYSLMKAKLEAQLELILMFCQFGGRVSLAKELWSLY